jgi:C4-type Zn-finger protein
MNGRQHGENMDCPRCGDMAEKLPDDLFIHPISEGIIYTDYYCKRCKVITTFMTLRTINNCRRWKDLTMSEKDKLKEFIYRNNYVSKW